MAVTSNLIAVHLSLSNLRIPLLRVYHIVWRGLQLSLVTSHLTIIRHVCHGIACVAQVTIALHKLLPCFCMALFGDRFALTRILTHLLGLKLSTDPVLP